MSLNETIFDMVRGRGAGACMDFINSYGAGRDRIERETLAHWRAAILESEGKFADALEVLSGAAADFDCKSSLALQKAQLLSKLRRVADAVAVLRSAPIAQEVETYPGLAWEAAYFGCYLERRQGRPAPREWLDLIPDDFTMRIDNKSVGKGALQSATR